MVQTEALFNRAVPGEEHRWGGREGVEKLAQLQGQRDNLSAVLVNHMPHHTHFSDIGNIDSHPLPLQAQVLSIFREGGPSNEGSKRIKGLYTDYLVQEGIQGTVIAYYDNDDPLGTFSVDIESRQNLWNPRKTKELFPMIDFIVEFEMSERVIKRAPYRVTHTGVLFPSYSGLRYKPSFFINTTRVKGSQDEYKLDIPLGENVLRTRQTIKDFIVVGVSHFPQLFHELGIEDRIDVLVISQESQELITALLAARV